MKSTLWSRCCIGVVLMLAQFLAGATSRTAATVERPSSNDAAAARLLSTLKNIADAGNLFDVAGVPTALAIPMDVRIEDTSDKPDNCARHEWESRREERTTATMVGRAWFHSQSSGAGHLHVPAVAINPEMVTSDPEVRYEKTRRVACSGSFGLRDHTQARLTLAGIPAYACLQAQQIVRLLPGAQFSQATDGVSLVRYQGRTGDDAGTVLTFSYRMGVGCALSAQIEQDQQWGLRFLRAQYKRSICQAGADRHYCKDHPELTWSDGAAVDRMRQHADRVCGDIDSLYQAEPLNGESPPPPLHGAPRRSPCG